MKSLPFYDTIGLSPNELKIENARAKGLEDKIEIIFKINPVRQFSGWQMKHQLETLLEKKVNLNSVRRSITNLKNKGILTKTEILVMGDEGKNEHLYRLTWISEHIKQTGKQSVKAIQTDLFTFTEGD